MRVSVLNAAAVFAGVEVTVTDFKYGTPLADMWAVLERADVLMAVEGSSFANQLFLPLNAGLFIIHGLKSLNLP